MKKLSNAILASLMFIGMVLNLTISVAHGNMSGIEAIAHATGGVGCMIVLRYYIHKELE